MHAIELQAHITATHEIHLQLPHTIRAGAVKVIVMYETIETLLPKKRSFGQFREKIHMDSSFDDELSTDFWLGTHEWSYF